MLDRPISSVRRNTIEASLILSPVGGSFFAGSYFNPFSSDLSLYFHRPLFRSNVFTTSTGELKEKNGTLRSKLFLDHAVCSLRSMHPVLHRVSGYTLHECLYIRYSPNIVCKNLILCVFHLSMYHYRDCSDAWARIERTLEVCFITKIRYQDLRITFVFIFY